VYSVFARNHIQYGLGYTKLFNTWGKAEGRSAESLRYLNNPPLLSVWTAIPMLIFGDSEWVGRSVAIAATLGSVWILMTIVSRLQSSALALLTGLFYVMLPMTAYFGRILEYTSATQFFSLLAIHGYLQWTGLYGDGCSRKTGALYYIPGVVFGIGTGWAVVIMAGLIWLWHFRRVFHNHSSGRLLIWLTVIPALSLAAVVVHIFWGCGWDIRWFMHLFLSRTGYEQPPLSGQWLFLNLKFIVDIFSIFGIGAAIAWLGIVPAVLRYTQADSPLRHIVRSKASVMPVLLTLFQGLIWVLLLRRQSWLHEYWQYFLAPFFAAAMAGVVLTIFTLLAGRTPRLAVGMVVLLMFLPIPSFAKSLDELYQLSQVENSPNIYIRNLVSVLKKLNRYVPPYMPVMTSENYETAEHIGNRTSYGMIAQAGYYANRPLIYTTDINEIETNSRNCAAYILRATNDPNMYQLAQQLDKKHKLVAAEGDYMIFLLNPPEKNAK
jgi:4-amino-4-deoxy-L-arabinose transferase-like glycosyltransferase